MVILLKTTPDKNLPLGFALAGFGTLLFSLKSIFIKFLYAEQLDADSVLVLRMLLSLPIYALILIWSLRNNSLAENLKLPAAAKICMLGFFWILLSFLIGSDEFGVD